MYYYMEHMKGYDLKRFFPALAWGVWHRRTSYHASFCECRCLGMPVWYSRYRFGVDVEEVESPSFESGIHG